MKAIVYTSNTGNTESYAKLLGKKTGLPVYSLKEATKSISKGTSVIYLGWLCANNVKGYKKAEKLFKISAVCGVGLCETGTADDQVRKINNIPSNLPLFTLQGGMDKTKLRGINKFMIKMLTKGLESKKERSPDEERMLELMNDGKNFVSEENISAVTQWYLKQ